MQSIQNTRSTNRDSNPANNSSPFRIASNDSKLGTKVLELLSDGAMSEGLLLLGKNGALNVKVTAGNITKPSVEYMKGRLEIQLPRRMKSFDVCSKELRAQLAAVAISEAAIHALASYTATGGTTGRELLAGLVTLTTGKEQPSDAEISSTVRKAMGHQRISLLSRLKNAAGDVERVVKPETYPSVDAGTKALETLTGTIPLFRALSYYQSPDTSEAGIINHIDRIASLVKSRLGAIVTPEVIFDGRHDVISRAVQLLEGLAGHLEGTAYEKPIPPFLKITTVSRNPVCGSAPIAKNGLTPFDFENDTVDLLSEKSSVIARTAITVGSSAVFSEAISDARNLASLLREMITIDSEIRNPASIESANDLMERFIDHVFELPSALVHLKQHSQALIPDVIKDSMRAILYLRFHRGAKGLNHYNFLMGNDSWSSSNPDESDPAVVARAHADSYWAYVGFLAIDSYRDDELRKSVIAESLPLFASMASRSLRVPLAVISHDVESREEATGEDIAYLRETAPDAIEDLKKLKDAADTLVPVLSLTGDKERLRDVCLEAQILEQFFSELSGVGVALTPLVEQSILERHRFKNALVTILERSQEELLNEWSQEAGNVRSAIRAEFDDSCDLAILVAKFQEALTLAERAPDESSGREVVEYVDKMLKALAANIQAMTDYEVEYALRDAAQYSMSQDSRQVSESLFDALDVLHRQDESMYTLMDVVQQHRELFDPSQLGFLRSVREQSRSKAAAWFQKNPGTFVDLVYAVAGIMAEENSSEEMRHRARQVLLLRPPHAVSNTAREAIRRIETRLKALDQ